MAGRPILSKVLVALAVLTLGGAGLGGWRLKHYVDTDPGLCAHCHRASPEFALWIKGGHRSVACQKCHHSTPEQGLAMLRAFLSGANPAGSEPHARVEVGACASCHLSHDPKWPQVGGSRGHRVHVEQRKIACVTCHATGVHGFEPVVTSCQACHGQHAVREARMQQFHCFACHDFLSREPGLRPTRRDCLRCHRAEGVLPARFADDAPMQFACGACHKPHARPPVPERVACETCHRGLAKAGLHAWKGHGACRECHHEHIWRAEVSDCLRCHERGSAHVREHARGAGKKCVACHGFAGAAAPIPPVDS